MLYEVITGNGLKKRPHKQPLHTGKKAENIICGQDGLCPRSPHLAVLRRFERSEEQAKPVNWRKTEGFSTNSDIQLFCDISFRFFPFLFHRFVDLGAFFPINDSVHHARQSRQYAKRIRQNRITSYNVCYTKLLR